MMTSNLLSFLAMGGYGQFIWPAYGLVFLVMASLVTVTVRTLRARERTLMTLQDGTSDRTGERLQLFKVE